MKKLWMRANQWYVTNSQDHRAAVSAWACGALQWRMNENEIASIVVDAAISVHRELGPGLLESAYEVILFHTLQQRGLAIKKQVPVPIKYQNFLFNEGFRADLIVEDKVILELKSIETIHFVHKKQLLTYLKLTNKKLGLLLNFGEALMKDGIVRIVNGLPK